MQCDCDYLDVCVFFACVCACIHVLFILDVCVFLRVCVHAYTHYLSCLEFSEILEVLFPSSTFPLPWLFLRFSLCMLFSHLCDMSRCLLLWVYSVLNLWFYHYFVVISSSCGLAGFLVFIQIGVGWVSWNSSSVNFIKDWKLWYVSITCYVTFPPLSLLWFLDSPISEHFTSSQRSLGLFFVSTFYLLCFISNMISIALFVRLLIFCRALFVIKLMCWISNFIYCVFWALRVPFGSFSESAFFWIRFHCFTLHFWTYLQQLF